MCCSAGCSAQKGSLTGASPPSSLKGGSPSCAHIYLWFLTNNLCANNCVSYLSYHIYLQSEDILKGRCIKSSWCQATWVWGKLEGPRAGEGRGCQAAGAASEGGNQTRGKVTNLICLSFSCCWIPSVFPYGVSRSHLGSFRQKDFFSSGVYLIMVRENEDVINQWSLLFYSVDYFQSVLVCSCWRMKLKFPGCFQREGLKCPKVWGNFRLFCAQKWTGSWLCWYLIHAQKIISPE